MAFFTPRVCTSHPPDVTASIPNEILLEIFKLAAPDCIIPPADKHTDKLEDVDMKDESLFPYCLANVCQRWYRIMQAYPEWWSRVRIQMDQSSPDKILSEFRHILEFTKNVQPLHIFVGYSKAETFGVNPEVERELLHGIVAAIKPHIMRYEKIVIRARHGSSLPLISSGSFCGPNPLLRELRLECDSYPVVQSLPKGNRKLRHIRLPSPVSPCTKSFSISVSLGGPTFLDACFVPRFWKELFSGSSWASLKISNVKTDKTVNANHFLEAICRDDIHDITLEKVELPCEQTDPDPDDHMLPGFEIPPIMMRIDLTLISMNPTALIPFFSNKLLDNLTVDSCPTTGLTYPKSIYLYLENISENEEVADAVISVNPSELRITNCPGISDFTLGALGHSSHGGFCHCLRIIEIDGKTNITPSGLKRFIEGRRRISNTYYRRKGIAAADIPDFMDDMDYEFPDNATEPAPLLMLTISHPGYELATDYRKFFVDSICFFSWSHS